MARPIRRSGFLLSLVLVLLVPGIAGAAVDMSGEWYIEVVIQGSLIPGHASVTQSGTSLTIVTLLSCGTCFPDTSVGTIDPDTGAFSVSSTTYPAGALVSDGVVASDGYTYTANVFVNGNPEGSVSGSRCANGVVEPTEQCDDGNRSNVDCCTSTCTFKGAGTSCPSDDVQCTDSVCDGAGSCTHPFSAPGKDCDADGEHCTRDTCDGAGGCSVTGSLPAGVPCDSLNGEYFCTSDTCDGAGTCNHTAQNEGEPCEADRSVCTSDRCVSGVCTTTATTTCPTCETCDPTDGCVAEIMGCTNEYARGSILQLKSDPVKGDLVKWAWPRGQTALVGDLGATSAASGAVLCVIDRTTSSVVAAAELPPGSGWTGTPLRATFSHRSATGQSSARIKRIRPNLSPQQLAISAGARGSDVETLELPPASSQLIVELRHGSGVCWGSLYVSTDLAAQSATSRRYKK